MSRLFDVVAEMVTDLVAVMARATWTERLTVALVALLGVLGVASLGWVIGAFVGAFFEGR